MADHSDFAPDACSMAKSLAAGLPMGAIWASTPLQDLLGPGKHGTTFGGTPLICAGALNALEIIERDQLAQNAANLGAHLKEQIEELITNYPGVLREVRGAGLMIGVVLAENIAAFAESKRPASVQMVQRLHDAARRSGAQDEVVVRVFRCDELLDLRGQHAARANGVDVDVVLGQL